jgi:hypothetical protein
MSNIKFPEEMLAEIHGRLLNDLIYKGYNERIAKAYNLAVPFCVITDNGEKRLEYKADVMLYIKELEKHRLMYIEQNYPELIVPF